MFGDIEKVVYLCNKNKVYMKKIFVTLLFVIGTLFVSAQSKDTIKNAVSQTIKSLKVISYLRDNKALNKPLNTVSVDGGKAYVNGSVVIVPKELLVMIEDFKLENIKQ